jgi:ribonuclease-3
MPELAELEQRLGVTFNDKRLLERALTHHSVCPETENVDSYDTLEFLGDALLGAVVVEYIYRTSQGASEGEMTVLKSETVSRRVLAEIGQRLGLFPFIRVDASRLRTFNERSRDSLCADVLEALVGAIHLDQGPQAARALVEREILPAVEQVRSHPDKANPKGRLQQEVLRRCGTLPRYELLRQGGSTYDRTYTVGVYVNGKLLATGMASSKREAGRLAALEALRLVAEDVPPAPVETPPAEVSAEEAAGVPSDENELATSEALEEASEPQE